jgi:hypothetical protein
MSEIALGGTMLKIGIFRQTLQLESLYATDMGPNLSFCLSQVAGETYIQALGRL